MSINRRNFMKSAVLGTSVMIPPSLSWAKTGKLYRTALIGTGWWGCNLAREALYSRECTLTAWCDVDENQFKSAAAREIEQLNGRPIKKYSDYRELLDQEKPEIVLVATPDHWHPLITIAAIKSGADVYVEKPISHTIYEGKAMVKAARDYERVVQVDTHRRASPHNISGMKFLHSGKAGKIGMVRCFVHYGGGPGKVTPDSEPPKGLNWDFWCGPAPYRPFNKRIHPKGFRRFMDYANGQLGDWGIHWLDQVLWWTEELYPKTVSSLGSRFILRDNTDCPDTQVVQYEFENFICTWEHRFYAHNHSEKHNIGCYFYGTEGVFHMGWLDGWTFYPANTRKQIIHEDPQLHNPDQQNIRELFADFLSCVKSRKRPICDIEIGYRSTNMSLLGNLAMKVNRTIKWDGSRQVILDDDQANRLLRREYRHPWQYPV